MHTKFLGEAPTAKRLGAVETFRRFNPGVRLARRELNVCRVAELQSDRLRRRRILVGRSPYGAGLLAQSAPTLGAKRAFPPVRRVRLPWPLRLERLGSAQQL